MLDATSPELVAASEYIASAFPALSQPIRAQFTASLCTLLAAKYAGHWDAADPEKGSGYRCILTAHDRIIEAAARTCSIPLSVLDAAPALQRLTLWIDPGCVSLRDTVGQGIKEIWGKLPPALAGLAAATSAPPAAAATSTSTPTSLANGGAQVVDAAATAEFDALVGASPSKRSRAIAIVRPNARRAGAGATPPAPATPTALPPLHFTIEESTSPYVPSFELAATSSSSSRCPTPTPPLPLPASPLSRTSAETVMASSSASDPFFRPSSRASDASAGTSSSSAASCSIFSHSSNESRSSSIGSAYSAASSSFAGDKTLVAKATPTEMDAAALFTFPGHGQGLGQAMRSAPASPSKPRRATAAAAASRHGHTLSTSSAVSASSTSPANAPASGHTRTRSSASSIRVSNNPGTVQDYSNGKVGVLGGGVLLGSGSAAGAAGAGGKRKPPSRPSSAMSNNSSSGGDTTVARPRSKSRTPSSCSSSDGFSQQGGQPMWFNQHQYHPMPLPVYNPQQGGYYHHNQQAHAAR